MQISGTTPSPNAGSAYWNKTASDRKTAGQAAAQPQTEQDKVTISDAARHAQLQAQDTAQASAVASQAATGPAVTGQDAATDTDAAPADTSASAKDFFYGALGLDRPEKEEKSMPLDSYTAGRWLSAAVTVGALVSVLV
jgi:hypothetical protein